MKRLKFKAFYDSSEYEYASIYLGIDTFKNIKERAANDEKYSLAMDIGPKGKYYKETNLSNNVLILKTDAVRNPTMLEYNMMNEALRKKHFKFNRKTGELIYDE